MAISVSHFTLGVECSLITPASQNYRLPIWPPPLDFPVVVNERGEVVSRFGDTKWDLTPWSKKRLVINFGDGPQRKNSPTISFDNAKILRLIAGWMLWGPRNVRAASTLASQIKILRTVFVLCTEHNITADSLSKFPSVFEKLLLRVPSVNMDNFIRLFHLLYEQRDLLGFCILVPDNLRHLATYAPKHIKRQTAYIPPRIWNYQLTRLRDFLDDYLAHKQQIANCYTFCIDAYVSNFGSLSKARRQNPIRDNKSNPFIGADFRIGPHSSAKSYGSFSLTARRFGIEDLLLKWCVVTEKRGLMISTLSRYLRMVTEVGCAYLLNFSMMRIEECWALRCDCYEEEDDPNFGKICTLKGATKKTIKDDDARWVTSPSAYLAVDAMSSVSRLRTSALTTDKEFNFRDDDLKNPYLALSSGEPWTAHNWDDNSLSHRHTYPSYLDMIEGSPLLFDKEKLKITENDLRLARLVTPDLDTDIFKIGAMWPLAWHQLRRTGAVNMQASGIVSDASIQYQLKHATRAMSLYYGRGFSTVRLNESARAEYVRAMYEIMGLELARLFEDRYVSPYGSQHKAEILRITSEGDLKFLSNAAKSGDFSWRETLLGGCTKRGPCSYGGIDHIARCGGGDGRAPCTFALFDKHKVASIKRLKEVIELRLAESDPTSPYTESLSAQKRALEAALHATQK